MIGFRDSNKGFVIVWLVYILLFLADISTTLLNGDLIKYLETNPLYSLTHSLLPIVLLNLIIIALLYWVYNAKKRSPGLGFATINYMVSVIPIRCLAIYNAMSYVANPISIEQAQLITEVAKTQTTVVVAGLFYFPFIIAIITYWLWSLDHASTRK